MVVNAMKASIETLYLLRRDRKFAREVLKRYLRIDPHEFATARTFHLDDVKLTAKPVGSSSFTIRFASAEVVK